MANLAGGFLPVVQHLGDESVVALAGGPAPVHALLGGEFEAYGASLFLFSGWLHV